MNNEDDELATELVTPMELDAQEGDNPVLAPAIVLSAHDMKVKIGKTQDPRMVAVTAIPMAMQMIEDECSKLHHLGQRKRAERIRKCLAVLRTSLNRLWRHSLDNNVDSGG